MCPGLISLGRGMDSDEVQILLRSSILLWGVCTEMEIHQIKFNLKLQEKLK